MCLLYFPRLQLLAVACAIMSMCVLLVQYSEQHDEYSYRAYDFPEELLVPDLHTVIMVIEESLHYPIEGPNALSDWASNKPAGAGFVRLGPDRRMFTISMAHQLHCLRIIRATLAEPSSFLLHHSHHCLNYIRQMTLCNPDLTLERFDPLDRDFEVDRVGATHVCRDWSAVYAELSNNLVEFKKHVNNVHS